MIKPEDQLTLRIAKFKGHIITVEASENKTPYFSIDNNKIGIFQPQYLDKSENGFEDKEGFESFLAGTDNNYPEIHDHGDDTIWERIVSAWRFLNEDYSPYKEKGHESEYSIPEYEKYL